MRVYGDRMRKSLFLGGLGIVLFAAGLYVGFAPVYLDDLIIGHQPSYCGAAFRPSDRCGSGVETDGLLVPAVALLTASAVSLYMAAKAWRGPRAGREVVR